MGATDPSKEAKSVLVQISPRKCVVRVPAGREVPTSPLEAWLNEGASLEAFNQPPVICRRDADI